MKRSVCYFVVVVMLLGFALPASAETETLGEITTEPMLLTVESVMSMYDGEDTDVLCEFLSACLAEYEADGSSQEFLRLIAEKMITEETFDIIDIMNVRQVMAGLPEGPLPNDDGEDDGEASTMSTEGEIRALRGGIRPHIAAGQAHTVYLTSESTVLTWGKYYSGEHYVAVNDTGLLTTITSLTNIVDIAAGGGSALALKNDGTVWAWGANQYGQLGNNSTTDSTTPVQVKTSSGNLTNVTAIAMGDTSAVAITAAGEVYAWGDNTYGQLGNNTTTQSSVAVRVVGLDGADYLSGVKSISVGYSHVLALKADGTVCAWGDNSYGQLGNGTTTNSTYPITVELDGQAISSITDVSAGGKHSLALTERGKVYAWGANNKGQLGIGSTSSSNTPVIVSGANNEAELTYVTDIAAGYEFSAARRSNGHVAAWGDNYMAQLGDGTIYNKAVPTETSRIETAVRLYAGHDFLVAEKSNGQIWGIGANNNFQLGDPYPSTKSKNWSILYTPRDEIIEIGSSSLTAVMLSSDGTVFTAGSNSVGQLGNGTTTKSTSPVCVFGSDGTGKLTDVMKAKQGGAAFAIKGDGTLWYWGVRYYVNDSAVYITLPTQVKDSSGAYVTNIADFSKASSSSFVKGDGSVWTWNSTNRVLEPTNTFEEKEYIDGVAQIDGDLMLKTDGTVWTRGSNNYGQLGIGNSDTSYTTDEWVQVKGLNGSGYLTNIVQISSGMANLALSVNGTVYAWGSNYYGNCGNNSSTDQKVPVKVKGVSNSGYLSGVTQIKNFGSHSYAFMADGTPVGWGSNWDGQMATGGTTVQYKYPRTVFSSGNVSTEDYGGSYENAFEVTVNRWVYGRREKTAVDYFTFVHRGSETATITAQNMNANFSSAQHNLYEYNEETDEYDYISRVNGAYTLVPGKRYYLQVYGTSQNTPYRFRINSEIDEASDEYIDDYGDEIADAYVIPTVDEKPRHMTPGGIDYTNDSDAFKFTPATDGIHCIYAISDAALQGILYDDEGEMIVSSPQEENTAGFRIEWDLLAGNDYYITVMSESESGELPAYQLYIEHSGFDIYAYDVELLGYKNRITDFCKELFNDGNQHMSQTVYNEYELAFDEDLAVHELPESIGSISDGLAYEAAVREYFFTKQDELEEVKQGYLDIIEEYIEVEPLSMNAEVEPLSPNAVMNIDEAEGENQALTIIRRPSGGAGAPLSVVQSTSLTMTDEIIENETVAEMTATTSSGARPLLKVISKTENSITIQAKFPTPGAVGNEIWVVDLNNGETKEKLIFSGSQTTDESKVITSSMLDDGIIPGGIYVIGMYWSTDGGVTNGGENARFVWAQLPPNTETGLALSTSSNQKVQVRVEAGDKAESSVNSIDYFTPWINNMGSVYETLQDFTGYTPIHGSALEFRSTRASMNGNNLQSQDEIDNEENYWLLVAGYASNPAMISRPFFRSFMMRIKDGDWGDAVIHEMSHAFDHDNWSFDMEVWADLKLCYVLEQHPGSKIYRFDTKEYYDKDTIYDFFKSEQYYSYDNTFAKGEYHHRGMTAVMLDIAGLTGWDAFRTVLHDMNDLNEDEYKYIYEENLPEPMAKFNLFISKLNTLTDVDIITAVLNQPVAEGKTKTVAEVITDCYGGYVEYYNLLRTSPTLVNKETVNKQSAGYVVRRFIPDETGMYYFFTTRYGGTGVTNDTVIEIFEDDYLTILKKRSNSSTGTRFSMVGVQLNANQTYYIKVRAENNECILHADIDVHKGEIEQLTGAESVDKPAGQAGIFEFKPTRGGDYVISTSVHDNGAPGITDSIIEVFEKDLSNRIARSTYEQAKFPGITVAGLTSDKTYYIVLKGYVGRQVKAELSIRRPSYTATVEYHFDKGYKEKYGNEEAARAEIMKYHDDAVERFGELCNLIITLHNNIQPAMYTSIVDACEKEHLPGVICTCNDSEDFIQDAEEKFAGTETKTVGIWSGNPVFCWGEVNRSFSNGVYIVMTEQNKYSIGSGEKEILGVLIHELAHQYKVRDHYHEEDENENCMWPDICSDCNGKNARHKDCIMNDARLPGLETMSGDELFCTGCKNDILTHLNDHH